MKQAMILSTLVALVSFGAPVFAKAKAGCEITDATGKKSIDKTITNEADCTAKGGTYVAPKHTKKKK
jgi:hypothetical protein